ncbi:MAG: MFS transporter [Oscillospiraceae bacterium]|nr:MFS transporter [Oscillospiraceae bacterium]
MKKNDSGRLPLKRVLSFAVGDIFGGGSFNIINFLYPGFLAFAVGLPAHTAGMVMMAARIFDAVSDPAMGFVSDRMRVKFGTRRGSLVASAPLIALSMFLMFYPYQNPSVTARFLLVLASYIFFCAVQTSVMIPYFSLSSEITEDYTERARLTSVRLGFSIFSSIVCVAVPGIIVDSFEGNTGYIAMSLSFGALFMVCIGITGLFAKEGVSPPKKAEPFSFGDFVRPFRSKPFRQYLYIFICCQMTMAIMSALFFFYVDFCFHSEATRSGESNITGLIGAALMFGMQIVALPFYLALIKKTSKTMVYIVGSIIWIAGALFLLAIPANSSPAFIYALAAVLGFGISGPGLIPHAIFADVVDAGTLQFGICSAGAFSGIANFINKMAQALGLAFVMFGIGAAGFIEQKLGEAPVTEQSASAQGAIKLIMALAPLAFMSIGIFVCTRYRLNKEKHAEVLSAIENGSKEKKAEVLKSL